MDNELVRSSQKAMQMTQIAFEKAIEQGAAMDVVNTILAQQRWAIERDEKQAFTESLKRIQQNLKKIPKRGQNKETNSWYALPEDIDAALKPLLDKEGMTLSFEPRVSDKPDNVLIVGLLSLGAYTKEYPLDMPADGKGAKGGGVMSRTHATGSAITYGKRYLKDMIFDLTSTKDDDGNGAGVTNEQGVSLVNAIKAANSPEATMAAWKKAQDVAKKFEPMDFRAMHIFTEARDERLKELKKAAK